MTHPLLTQLLDLQAELFPGYADAQAEYAAADQAYSIADARRRAAMDALDKYESGTPAGLRFVITELRDVLKAAKLAGRV